MTEIEAFVQKELLSMKDENYKQFNSSLIPGLDKASVIGVRTPALRSFSKELFKKGDYKAFLGCLPHTYFEENNLHGFIIEQIRDYDVFINELERFLPYIDNWATCDLISLNAMKKHNEKLIAKIRQWLDSEHTYTVRFAIKLLMTNFLDGDFKEEYLFLVSEIHSEEYYINMAIAWYFATALAKQYDSAVQILEKKLLSKWVHNKTIQKAVESYRISDEQKCYLKTLKMK